MMVKMGILFLQKLHPKSPAPAVMCRKKIPTAEAVGIFLA